MRATINAFLRRIPEWALWLAGAVPLGLLGYDLMAGQLGVDPVRDIEHRLGRTALYFLVATLAVTPLARFAGLRLIHLRRALGLLAFSYAALHIAAWALLDMGLLWAQMLRDVTKRPYLLFGAGAALILLILALTSNRASIRRLGPWWRRLHRLSYLAALLACLHWLWSLKIITDWAAFVTLAILLLLILRLPVPQKNQK
ncbi:MAG: protein-methionine-sulfoxide reductase heme-binding subunit MsrQ [Paracoccus sp. (in: a-proteobacteria)]|nr:protein-methionine-sulfoxide reductase heme-binding subunit MsrQ [Paracoccus sp. (in: a-proteobacteria)]